MNGRHPQVSIITPTLDAAATLGTALASLEGQGVDWEAIVVDGGSHDGTRAIAESRPGVRFLALPGSSIYAAINAGLAAAGGEIVGLLNADDALLPGALAAVLAAFGPASEVVLGGAEFVEEAEGALRHARDIERRAAAAFDLELILEGPLAINRMFFRRRLFERLGPFDPSFRLAADRDWALRLMIAGVGVTEIPRPVYRYLVHAGSSTIDRAARNYGLIRAEHLAIARRALARASVDPRIARALRRWHAGETARLATHLARRGEVGAGVRVLAEAFRTAPGWPLALPGWIRRRLGERAARRAVAAPERR